MAMGSGMPAAIGRDHAIASSPAKTIILVTGLPAAGKTTVSQALSEALTLPLLSKDAIKESLFDVLGVRDREWSLQLGAAANSVLWALLSHCPKGAIVDIWLDPIRDVGLSQQGLARAGVKAAFEVICDCPAELACPALCQSNPPPWASSTGHSHPSAHPRLECLDDAP